MESQSKLHVPALNPKSEILTFVEAVGVNYGRQLLVVSCPANVNDALFVYRNQNTGALFPAQRSKQNSGTAFLQMEVEAHDKFHLIATDDKVQVEKPVTMSVEGPWGIVSNGKWSAEIFLGEWEAQDLLPSYDVPTPVSRVRVADGPWRGRMFFDTREAVRRITSTVLESGPLRIVTEFRASIGATHSYLARLTFDAGSDFIRIEEEFEAGAGDQIVWDFSGEDLPAEIYLLDSSAGFATQPLTYFLDRRLARLASWNQFSQLHDYSDGYAFSFARSDDVVGVVTLKGGDWDGNAHNFLEAWARRWFPGDPESRRLVPGEAKADAAPSPERIESRPANRCEAHFSIEGWLHRGKRSFALVLSSKSSLRSADWNAAPPLGHFETEPNRLRYRQQQSLLRRIHTQHGMFPLAEQVALDLDWPQEKSRLASTPPPWIDADTPAFSQPEPESIPERVTQILEFLAARVYGFWEGSGSAYTNPVVSRRLAHDLVAWEWLSANGHLTADQNRKGRAWFAFLCQLFHSDHYYPGSAAMNLGTTSQSLEPTVAGMANQNFFTDVFNLPGLAAQVFASHPNAGQWRERFTTMWRRQLEYHVYSKSGIWEESHTYFHHVLQTIIPTLERRLQDGVEDGFADPMFQKLVASALKTLSPRDACFDGKRHVVTLGDHGVDPHDLYRRLYRTLAHHIARTNPDLAAQLAWAYREMDGKESLELQPTPLPWRDEYVEGLGYFFRAEDERGESLMVLRCGNSWAHHHNDEGSLQFFSAGRSWIVDAAFSLPPETGARKFRADGHSRWSPSDINPLNHLWQFNRGWIVDHQEDVPFPYAVAFTPVYLAESSLPPYYLPLRTPILHWRAVVRLAPSTFLILDRSDRPLAQSLRFHLPLDAPFALGEGDPSSQTEDGYLRLWALHGLQSPQFPAIDHPKEGDSFSTREVRFACNDQPLAALIITVEKTGAPSELSMGQTAHRISIVHPKFSAELDISNPENILLLDQLTGHRSTLALSSEPVAR